MTFSSRIVVGSAVVGVFVLTLAAFSAAQTPPPGIGTWTLNVAKSK